MSVLETLGLLALVVVLAAAVAVAFCWLILCLDDGADAPEMREQVRREWKRALW